MIIITKCLKCGAVYEIRTNYDVKLCPACGSPDIDKTIEDKSDEPKTE